MATIPPLRNPIQGHAVGRPMRAPILPAVLLLALLLAGCSGAGTQGGTDASGPSGSGHPTGTVSGTGAQVPLAGKGGPLRYAALAAPMHKTLWANGTVAAQDACNTGGCGVTDSRAERTTDITDELPAAGVPVSIQVELTYPDSLVFTGAFDSWIEAPHGTYYSYTGTYEGGHVLYNVTLLPGDSVQVVMAAYWPGGGTTETPYTLRIAIDADPSTVTEGIPIGVLLSPGSSLDVRSVKGGAADYVLYGPDDALVGRFKGNHTLPAQAAKGQYAVLLAPDSPAATLWSSGGDGRLVLLGLRFVVGPPGDLPPSGAYDGTWDVAGYPVGVGLLAYSVQSAAGPAPILSVGFSMRMTGPNGFRLETPTLCHVCANLGFGTGWGSGLGDERVTAGTYALHAETSATYQVQVRPYAAYLDRA
jgi:hypothetical protein